MNRRSVVLLLVVALLTVAATSSTVFASHPRPIAASPMTWRLVPAFKECVLSGPAPAQHRLPLALPACQPPELRSSYLTMTAPDRPAPFNKPVSFSGYVTQRYIASPADIRVTVGTGGGGIRCVGVAGQSNCAGGPASLYNGKLLLRQTLRITDHGASCADYHAPFKCPGTLTDFENHIGVQCASGNCDTTTSFNAVMAGWIAAGDRLILEESQLLVDDAGLNGDLVPAGPYTTGVCPPACDQDDAASVFLTQGMFAP